MLVSTVQILIYYPCTNTDTTYISETAYKGQVQLADGDSMTNPRPLMLYTSTAGASEWGYVCIPQQFQNITLIETQLAGTVCRQLGFTNYSFVRPTKGYGYN